MFVNESAENPQLREVATRQAVKKPPFLIKIFKTQMLTLQ
jgi:hypothetical protein